MITGTDPSDLIAWRRRLGLTGPQAYRAFHVATGTWLKWERVGVRGRYPVKAVLLALQEIERDPSHLRDEPWYMRPSRVKDYRTRLGLTLKALAAELGCSYQYLSRLELGQKRCPHYMGLALYNLTRARTRIEPRSVSSHAGSTQQLLRSVMDDMTTVL